MMEENDYLLNPLSMTTLENTQNLLDMETSHLATVLFDQELNECVQELTRNVESYDEREQEKIEEMKKKIFIHMSEEMYKIRCEISNFRTEVLSLLKRLDLKKCKKNRTLINRCTYTSGKKSCAGYICKKSNSFCYSHHMLATGNHSKFLHPKKNHQ